MANIEKFSGLSMKMSRTSELKADMADAGPFNQTDNSSRYRQQQQQQQQQQQHVLVSTSTITTNNSNNNNHIGRLANLRKYSTVICALEAIAIILIVGYLYVQRVKSPASNPLSYPGDPFASRYTTYSNGYNSTKISISVVIDCNQRKHDLQYGVRCLSSTPEQCKLSPDDAYLTIQDDIEPNQPQATVVVSSRLGERFHTRKIPIRKIECPSETQKLNQEDSCKFKPRLTVYVSEPQQEIIGWGGALTDSSINNILSLTTNGTKKLLDNYFSPKGLNFNLVRVTIGGSDFSSRFYTNNDFEEDFKMDKFKLLEEDTLYKIPMIKYIQDQYKDASREGIKLFASMWSPPTWMKTNGHFNKGFVKGSISSNLTERSNDERYFKALAELKKTFLLAYQNNSINFWAMTIMNEPLFAVQPFLNFNTMIFPREDYANYVAKYLGPIFKQDDRLKDIKLIVHDDNRRYLINYTDPILTMPEVRRFIDGISTHGYIDEDYQLMDKIYLKHKSASADFFILPTELSSGHLPFMEKAIIGNWHRGVHYALDIIHSVQHSAAGWVDWNMVLDTTGGPGWLGGRLDSPVIVDKTEDSFYMSPMFYALGHFSRYVPPRSFKLKSQIINDVFDYQFETVSFLLPNKRDLATVILNHNPYSVNLNIQLVNKEEQGGSIFQVIIPPDSFTTIIYPNNLKPAS